MKSIKPMKSTALGLTLLLLVIAVLLCLKPPDILHIGANYAAKSVCSNVFLAGRDADEVLRDDVQAPGVAILRLMRVSVDRQRGVVRAGLLGFIGRGVAVLRPGAGCTVVPDGNIDFALRAVPAAAAPRTPPPADQPWPEGNGVTTVAALGRVLADDALAGPGMRAIVVVDHGRIAAARYGEGFSAQTPLLGWSMSKSVLAGLVGVLVREGRLTLDQSGGWPAGDGRERIRVADLLAMSSGLKFNETYGSVSDVTRMLYLEPDMARFARAQPLIDPVGEHWNYSSGTALILSRLVQDAAGLPGIEVANDELFAPLGMSSAVMESDEHGTLVGSSFMYATARDWARYALFLLQDGVWRGRELLPRGFVAMMAAPVTSSGGGYGQGLVWLSGSDVSVPGRNPDAGFGIPADCFWMEGHDGQFGAVIASRQLAVLRLGLTPARAHYAPQPLVKAVLDALTQTPPN